MPSPLTVRPSPLCEKYVSKEAKRRRQSRSEIVRELTDEAIKLRMFPGIVFLGEHRRAAVSPRWDVWQVVAAVHSYDSPNAAARDLGLKESEIELALGYYDTFKDEIDSDLEALDGQIDHLRTIAPHIETL